MVYSKNFCCIKPCFEALKSSWCLKLSVKALRLFANAVKYSLRRSFKFIRSVLKSSGYIFLLRNDLNTIPLHPNFKFLNLQIQTKFFKKFNIKHINFHIPYEFCCAMRSAASFILSFNRVQELTLACLVVFKSSKIPFISSARLYELFHVLFSSPEAKDYLFFLQKPWSATLRTIILHGLPLSF